MCRYVGVAADIAGRGLTQSAKGYYDGEDDRSRRASAIARLRTFPGATRLQRVPGAAKAPHHLTFGLSWDPAPAAATRPTGHAAIPYAAAQAGARRAPGRPGRRRRASVSPGARRRQSRAASGDWGRGGARIQYRVWRRFAVRGSTTRQDPSTGSD